eukprot:CAMPEP_0206233074 /NCGR_PEP_ID=MMETSP0047_2-20121206/11776_1 /ASSEMBLY_ACC=CAM_ASM_000192 /TAXON_ID=195065 /ORGANISM="Chroomonas mesostigmatica_cf, Strain CCMP1168" /LENGTH=799 /DNA_ID=CAMNT_0053656895 /DNA_START=147 /DNA_END=2546 /DNA_ORIENTATION=+
MSASPEKHHDLLPGQDPDARASKADLMETKVQPQYEKQPLSVRALKFLKDEYSPTNLIPPLTWVPEYVRGGWRENLYGDVFAGLTVGAFLIPQGMSYALVAELPPIYGLYTACFPLIIYALLGTSRQLAVGPVAIVSLLIGHGVKEIQPPKLEDGTPNPEFISLCIAASLLSGILQVLMGLLRLGYITSFLSHPVVSGFTSAAAIIIGLGQFKHLVGFSLSSDTNTFVVIIDMLSRLGEAHWQSILLGIAVIAFLWTFKNVQRLKKLPAAMIVVVLSILISWGGDFAGKGIKITGEIPGGIPAPSIPKMPSSEHLGELMILVFVLTLIGYMESIAVGLTYANKNRYKIRSNQELLAFGACNIVGSLFSCYPAAGGFGRSAVNANSGSKTQLAGLISGFVVMIVLAALTPYFYHLPKPSLGAIVIVAVIGLLDTAEPKHLYHTKAWGDLISLVVTFFGTLLIGPELGIGIGVGCSILVLLYQASKPTYTTLGNIPGTAAYHNIKVMPAARSVPGVLIIRFDADLWFANCTQFKEAVLGEVRDSGPGFKRLILDLSGVNMIDSSAMHALHEIVNDVRKATGKHMPVAVAGAKRKVRTRLLQELCAGSYLSPTDGYSQMVAGRTPAQIRALFEKQEGALDGWIPKEVGRRLAEELHPTAEKPKPSFNPFRRDAKGESVAGFEVEEEQEVEAGMFMGFPEFVELLRTKCACAVDTEIIMYSTVHAAVQDEAQLGSEPAEEGGGEVCGPIEVMVDVQDKGAKPGVVVEAQAVPVVEGKAMPAEPPTTMYSSRKNSIDSDGKTSA